MRAQTKGKNEIGRRFAVVIGVAAAGVMALGAQTGTAASEDVVSYGTKLTITHEGQSQKDRGVLWHGGLRSGGDRRCVEGRRVVLFKKRPGPDRELGYDQNPEFTSAKRWFNWEVVAPVGGRVYAKVTPKVGDGFVCRADRSRTIKNGDLCFEDPSFCSIDEEEAIRAIDETVENGRI